jgi:hypothetical protein
VFTEQSIAGGQRPIASRDAWMFAGNSGAQVTVVVDTVSADTAYIMEACVSRSPQLRDCVQAASRSRFACAFPPPGGLGCPRSTTALPADGVYYVIVGGIRLTRTEGQYTAVVKAQPGIGVLSLAVNDAGFVPAVEP